ncbi:MAG: hypothetical protein AMS20_13945, partial [Gemmatimonas sp. SG8_28]
MGLVDAATQLTEEAIALASESFGNTAKWKQVNLQREGADVEAYLLESGVASNGLLHVMAHSDQTIDAIVGAGSVAIGGGGAVGVGLPAAGVSTEIFIATDPRA